MNLKSFHLFFIAMSVILAAYMTAWSVNNGSIVGACVSIGSAVALVVYGASFQRKMRRL